MIQTAGLVSLSEKVNGMACLDSMKESQRALVKIIFNLIYSNGGTKNQCGKIMLSSSCDTRIRWHQIYIF